MGTLYSVAVGSTNNDSFYTIPTCVEILHLTSTPRCWHTIYGYNDTCMYNKHMIMISSDFYFSYSKTNQAIQKTFIHI